ncbi:MAG: hypothetical protein HXM11_03170, partial [Fusobacterium periodonticum]|nr:hypothetical protein [Fusobacterium periodonticum]
YILFKELKNNKHSLTIFEKTIKIYYENNEKVYNISCGIMITGYLLVINLYSASKEEVENAMKYIYSIEKIK